jgi:hypothetical protein
MDKTVTTTRQSPADYYSMLAYTSDLFCSGEWRARPFFDCWERVNKNAGFFFPEGHPGCLPDLPAFDDMDLRDQAVTSAWSNIDLSEVDSLVAIAESGKTVISLISMAGRFIKVIRMMKKLDAKGLLHELTPKELTDRYMELRYAIRPLLYDVRNFSHAIQKSMTKPRRQTFRGFAVHTDDGDHTQTDEYYYSGSYGSYGHDEVYETKWSRRVDIRAGVLCELDVLNKPNVFGLTQPVEALWELVPFSFIIDWFFNVGRTLSAWSPEQGTKALASWYMAKTVEYQYAEHRHENHYHNIPPQSTVHLTNFERSLSDCWCDKTVVSHVRVPSPVRAVVPSFSLNLDWLKLTDLLIIGYKLMGGKSMPKGTRI